MDLTKSHIVGDLLVSCHFFFFFFSSFSFIFIYLLTTYLK